MTPLHNFLEASWRAILNNEIEQDYFIAIEKYLHKSVRDGAVIYPRFEEIFAAFLHSDWQKTRVVILGQDPYHGEGQAHGLSFSVQNGVKIPPSLRNIYKELANDIRCSMPTHGDLLPWAKQGVLLLNTSLTVEAATPMSHSKIGWEKFTDAVIKKLSAEKSNVVFVLWGAFAHKKAILIDAQKHLILKSAHPSPLSAYNGFYGSKPFSTANNYLIAHNQQPIYWPIR
jgi:uracil-DNA glycosylase